VLVTVVDDHRFRAMGTDCHVQLVDAPAGTVDVVEALVRADEDRWSRFRPTSELSQLNAGATTEVGDETAELLALALAWRARTGGRFDPLLGAHLRAAGYDRSFDLLDHPRAAAAPPAPPLPPVLDGRTVRVPAGVEVDLGGIAKGHAADRAVAAALAAGAAGACVNLGGDLRCAGDSPAGDGWWCALDHGTGADASGLSVGLAHGAIATSTTTRRRWTTADGAEHHHLLDPFTGRPGTPVWHTATVVAATAAAAEVLAKVVLLAPPAEAAEVLAGEGAVALATDHAGAAHRLGDVDPLLAPTGGSAPWS